MCIVCSYSTVTERNGAMLEALEDVVGLKLYGTKEIELDVEIEKSHYTFIYVNQIELFNLLNIKLQ